MPYEPFEYAGHRYDIQVIGADMEFVAIRRQLDQAKASGRILSGLEGLLLLETRYLIQQRARGIHTPTELFAGGGACSCGLVIPRELPLDRATGHLDDQLWEPVSTLLVSAGGAGWDEIPPCRPYCQACGWVGEDAPYEEADAARLAHGCDLAPTADDVSDRSSG